MYEIHSVKLSSETLYLQADKSSVTAEILEWY